MPCVCCKTISRSVTNVMKKVTQLLLTNKNENAYGKGMLRRHGRKEPAIAATTAGLRKYIN